MNEAATEEHGLPQMTILVAFFAILFAAIATFLLMRWSSYGARSETLRGEIATLQEEQSTVQAELDQVRSGLSTSEGRTGVLDHGTYVFCNDTAEPVIIRHFGSIHAKDNQFSTFSHSIAPDGLWTIAGGEKRVLKFVGSRKDWDGSYTYYGVVFNATYQGSRETFAWADNWTGADGECSYRFF